MEPQTFGFRALMLYHSCHAIDIADASSMQDAFHMNFVRSPLHISDGLLTSWYTALTMESLWLSGRASERGILGSEIRFLMRTQNFFLVPRSWQDEKTSVSIIILFTHLLKNVIKPILSSTFVPTRLGLNWNICEWTKFYNHCIGLT